MSGQLRNVRQSWKPDSMCRMRKRTGGSPRQRSLCELRHLVFKKRRHLIFKMTARGDRTLHHRCHVRSRRSPEKLPFTGNAFELYNSAGSTPVGVDGLQRHQACQNEVAVDLTKEAVRGTD